MAHPNDENRRTIGRAALELMRGDLTRQAVDAIVNAANSSLLGGGGVDGAIHRAGGPQILEQCRAIRARRGSLAAGLAVITTGGRLKARHVIHTVGPVYQRAGGEAPRLLASCYRRSLDLAADNGLRSVAFPSISTGAYGYPVTEAARVAVRTVVAWLTQHPDALDVVRLVHFSAADHAVYRAALEALDR